MSIWTGIKTLFSRIFTSPVDEWERRPWTDDEMERRVCEILIRDERGWTYQRDDVRERYESECG